MAFRYINPGYYNFFDTYSAGTNLKDTSIVKTNGGQCFRGGTTINTISTYSYTVNLPAAKEYWARFDLNRYNNQNAGGGDNTYIHFVDEKGNKIGILTCCCSPFLSLPCPRHLPKTAHLFCRIAA